jgi:outer membrane protein assembly factor BamB
VKLSAPTEGDPESSPAIGIDGTIYVGGGGKLFAINPNGTLQWSFVTGDNVPSSPAIDEHGTIYVGSLDNHVYAVYPDGTEKWNVDIGDQIWTSPAISSDGTIYVAGYWDGILYAISPNGSMKWSFRPAGAIDSSPAISADGTIYITCRPIIYGCLYAINTDGTKKWNVPISSYTQMPYPLVSSPSIGSDGTVYVQAGSSTATGEYSKLYAIGGARIVDDSDPEFRILAGTWKFRDHPKAYNGNLRYNKVGSGNNKAGWRIDTIITPGIYYVYTWKFEHKHSDQMATNVHYKVRDRTSISDWILVDQSTPGDEWVCLGSYEFDNSHPQGVLITDNADGFVIADALRLLYIGSLTDF